MYAYNGYMLLSCGLIMGVDCTELVSIALPLSRALAVAVLIPLSSLWGGREGRKYVWTTLADASYDSQDLGAQQNMSQFCSNL